MTFTRKLQNGMVRFLGITALALADAALGLPQMHYATACMIAAILIKAGISS